MFSLSIPAYHAEVSKMLADTDPATWRAYLRFHLVDDASPYLSDAFVQENYNFYGKVLGGQKEIKARGKRVLQTNHRQCGAAMGQTYVKVPVRPDARRVGKGVCST